MKGGRDMNGISPKSLDGLLNNGDKYPPRLPIVAVTTSDASNPSKDDDANKGEK